MIIGENNTTKKDMIVSKFEFFLTGSRRYGTNHQYSDEDFYALYSKEVVKWLKENNFSKLHSYYGYYKGFDQNTVSIWRKGNVDIQLVYNLIKRQYIDKFIINFPEFMPKHKHDRRDWFNTIYKILE